MPLLDRNDAMEVLRELGCFDPNAIGRCAEEISGDGIGIKQLYNVIEMARADGGVPISHAKFADCLRSYGL